MLRASGRRYRFRSSRGLFFPCIRQTEVLVLRLALAPSGSGCARPSSVLFFVCLAAYCANSSMTEGRGYQFTWCDGAFCLISMLLSFIGILSDGWLVYTYARNELWVYFFITLFLALVPPVVINAFSISWHIEDNSASIWKWFFSIVLFGTIQRNWAIFLAGCKAQKTKDQKDFRVLYRHKRDLCVLDLYKSFLKSAPQLVLQLYIMLDTQDWRVPTLISSLRAITVLPWCMAAYDRTERRCRPEEPEIPLTGTILQFLWRFGTVGSRIGAMVLRGIVDDAWAIFIFGTHFLVTTFFAMVVTQLMVKKKVAADAPFWQKLAHGIAMGAGFTFCFINIGDSLSNNVALAGLILMYTYAGEENLESILTYHREWTNGGYHLHGKIAMAAVGISFLIGVGCMCWYRNSYHPACEVSLFPSRTPLGEDVDKQAAGNPHRDDGEARSDETPADERTRILSTFAQCENIAVRR
ncbi:XK-related protein 6-like [Amblyomma americanum]